MTQRMLALLHLLVASGTCTRLSKDVTERGQVPKIVCKWEFLTEEMQSTGTAYIEEDCCEGETECCEEGTVEVSDHNEYQLEFKQVVEVFKAVRHRRSQCVCQSNGHFLFYFGIGKDEVCSEVVCAKMAFTIMKSRHITKSVSLTGPSKSGGVLLLDNSLQVPQEITLGSPCHKT